MQLPDPTRLAGGYTCLHQHIVPSNPTQVRCWEIAANGTSVPKAACSHDQPVLCSAWNADGSSVFTGGCDKTAKMWNLATNQQQVRCVASPRSPTPTSPAPRMRVLGLRV